jgi:DNA-binding transcriptional MerR regulator
MDLKAKSEKKKPKRELTTGQASGLTRIGRKTLYNYVRTYPEFFSSTVRQHSPGRRWTQEDLEMVQAIRCLHHERAGTEKIRELIAGGWRLQDDPSGSRELTARLIESILGAYADLKESSNQVVILKNIIEQQRRENEEFQELWIRVRDLEHEWEVMQKAWRLRTVITKAVKKKYHGEPPELYPPKKPAKAP